MFFSINLELYQVYYIASFQYIQGFTHKYIIIEEYNFR